ncbi:hypothetical protein JL49_13465 [Pseudoalteromonas luteoviolacea]|nr:hypothetical protein JL49_13465 [Pseudoalteromonas luteoviolacea]
MDTIITSTISALSLLSGAALAIVLREFFESYKTSRKSKDLTNVFDMQVYLEKKAIKYDLAAGVSDDLVEQTILLKRRDDTLDKLGGNF